VSIENPICRKDLQELAKKLGYPVKTLQVMASNCDPYICGSTAQEELALWFAELFEKYRRPGAFHIRRLHYQMVSVRESEKFPDGAIYQNTLKDFNELNAASRYARHLGLVDPAEFTDRRNPEHMLIADYTPPNGYCREPAASVEDIPQWQLPSCFVNEASFEFPGILTDGYGYCLRDQPYHLELWIEKSTMNDVLVPICERYGVNLVPAVGMQSITSTVDMLMRVNDLPDDRPTRIGYISDFDPAGDCMPIAVARQVQFYIQKCARGRDIKLKPLALTREQVIQYNLPRIMIKDEDPRKANFEDRRGEGAVELDALEALVPGELAQMVEEFIAPYRDSGLERRLSATEEDAQVTAEETWKEETAPLRQEMDQVQGEVRAVLDRHEWLRRCLNELLGEELAPLQVRLDGIRKNRWANA
jgi:hypothetical protein